MRWPWLAVGWALWIAAPLAADEFPYVAYVNSGDVYVRSGPGRDYYPTDKLHKGERVEVWRHDPGGWCAIRPPRESFSWISQRHLDLRTDGLAVINTPRAVARVGSAFNDVREVIQVRLDKGELVALLEPPAEESPWCRIAPPSGEFRWVFSKYVDRDLPADLAADERESNGSGADGPRAVQYTSSEGSATGDRRAVDTSRNLLVDQEINRIELELSAMVAQEVNHWSFGELEERARLVLKQANGPAERGAARVLLDKLTRFEDIRQRHESLRAGTMAATGRPVTGGGDATRGDMSRYDGIGRLSPVVSDKPGSPQFALLDKANAVIAFVTPAPGVSLRPYVDKYIGVNGPRSYLTELQRQHINVQRVSVLDTQRR